MREDGVIHDRRMKEENLRNFVASRFHTSPKVRFHLICVTLCIRNFPGGCKVAIPLVGQSFGRFAFEMNLVLVHRVAESELSIALFQWNCKAVGLRWNMKCTDRT